MGGGSSREREEVDELRDDMISTFDSQRILLFGRFGAGKSSIINTFNHVTNLVQHDVNSVASIAETGSGEADTKTHYYRVYSTKTDGMYESLKKSKIGELRRLFTKAPEFIDTPGIPPYLDRNTEMKEFYKRALQGDVATGYNLQNYYQSVTDKKTIPIESALEAKKPWAVLAILAAGNPLQDFVTSQLAFLNDLKTANDFLHQGTRIFVVFTHSDQHGLDEKEKNKLKKRAATALNCSHDYIFFFDNYTGNQGEITTSTRDLAKEKAVITAFSEILALWNKPKNYQD